MGRLNEKYKALDFVFRHEYRIMKATVTELRNFVDVDSVDINGRIILSPAKWLNVIAETYEECSLKSKFILKLAQKRFRKGEFYLQTCFSMFISVSTYYRMLNVFFRIAERMHVKFFTMPKKMRIE